MCFIRTPHTTEDFSLYFKEEQFLGVKGTLLPPFFSFKIWRTFRLQHYVWIIYSFVSSFLAFQQVFCIYLLTTQKSPGSSTKISDEQTFSLSLCYFALSQEWKQHRELACRKKQHLKEELCCTHGLWLMKAGYFSQRLLVLLWPNHLCLHATVFPPVK